MIGILLQYLIAPIAIEIVKWLIPDKITRKKDWHWGSKKKKQTMGGFERLKRYRQDGLTIADIPKAFRSPDDKEV